MNAKVSNAQAGAVAAWIYEERYGHNDDAWIERIRRELPPWETRNNTPLYLSPPAAVPVEALERLVAEWRNLAKTGTFTNGSGEAFREALNDCADELTQLIKERSNG